MSDKLIAIAKECGANSYTDCNVTLRGENICLSTDQLRATVEKVCAPLVEALGKVIAANPTINMSKPDAFKYISSVDFSRKTLANYRTLIGDKE